VSWGSLESLRINLSNEQHLLCLFNGKVIRTKGKATLTINDESWFAFVTVPPSYTHIRFLYLLARTSAFQDRDFY